MERLGVSYRSCNEDEDEDTTTNLLWECSALSRARFRNFGALLMDDVILWLSFCDITMGSIRLDRSVATTT